MFRRPDYSALGVPQVIFGLLFTVGMIAFSLFQRTGERAGDGGPTAGAR